MESIVELNGRQHAVFRNRQNSAVAEAHLQRAHQETVIGQRFGIQLEAPEPPIVRVVPASVRGQKVSQVPLGGLKMLGPKEHSLVSVNFMSHHAANSFLP